MTACIIAVDPGSTQSAWVVYNPATGGIRSFGIWDNARLLAEFRAGLSLDVGQAAIEQIRSYGMSVGAEVFDTVHWSGRFTEALERHSIRVTQLPRLAVKQALCHDSRAKDPNIRAALIDRFGGPDAIRKGGPLYGISKDVWAALGVAVTWAETEGDRNGD